MLICLDYDETYTRDPEFWQMVIALAIQRGHRVICATMRHEHESAEMPDTIGQHVETIIYTGRKAKYDFVQQAGYYPSIWIDDMPHFLFHGG